MAKHKKIDSFDFLIKIIYIYVFRVVFSNRKKSREKNEVVHKKYILTEDLFDFGPLLVGNNKDR